MPDRILHDVVTPKATKNWKHQFSRWWRLGSLNTRMPIWAILNHITTTNTGINLDQSHLSTVSNQRYANVFKIFHFKSSFRKQIGHFTVMVNDKNNAIGCASVRYQENNFYYRYLVCNYGFTNILDRPVYEKGEPASKCKEPHPVYEGLCSTDQTVNPVP